MSTSGESRESAVGSRRAEVPRPGSPRAPRLAVPSVTRAGGGASVAEGRARLERAYDLAYFLLADRDAALETALESLAKLRVAAMAQDRRLAYVPKGRARDGQTRPRAFRTRPLHDEAHLLQRLVYLEAERFETRQERAGAACERALLLRYVKHLVRITLKRNSFHVALGVARLLHHYPTAATLDLHALVMQDAARTPDDDYCRARKRQLMAELQERFGPALRVVGGARGEQRFETRAPTTDEAALVEECLRRFTPWDTPCPLPESFDARLHELPELAFSGDHPDHEHPIETKRMHALLHPDCLRRLARALGLASPDERVAVPCFSLPPSPPPPSDGAPSDSPPGHGPAPPLAVADFERAAERLVEAGAGWGRHLRVSVDGRARAALDLARPAPIELEVGEGAETIEVHDEHGRLVGLCLLGGGRPARQQVAADDGGRLTFERSDGVTPGVRLTARAAWRRRLAFRFQSQVERLGLGRARPALPAAATAVAALLALLVCWPRARVEPRAVVIEPPASPVRPLPAPAGAVPRRSPVPAAEEEALRGPSLPTLALPRVRALLLRVDAPGAPEVEARLRATLSRELAGRFELAEVAERADGLLHVQAGPGRLRLELLDPAGRTLWRRARPVTGDGWESAASDAARALRAASRPAG